MMPMPPQFAQSAPAPAPEELALQGALSGGPEAPPEEEMIDPEELMQLIQMAQQSGDPRVMAILQQLMAALQAPPPTEGEDVGPMPEE